MGIWLFVNGVSKLGARHETHLVSRLTTLTGFRIICYVIHGGSCLSWHVHLLEDRQNVILACDNEE
jgi:hypothetical protein